tara:strand:- start:537 stop:1007 length:471 start_codon:yes stop_codon:yes gene_type:complete
MKKVILLSLLVMFGCDEDNPVASVNNKIPLNWAVVGSDCFFTADNNKCDGYGDNIVDAYKFEIIELTAIQSDSALDYVIELCNSVIPPILEESDLVAQCQNVTNFDEACISEYCFEDDDGVPNYYDDNSNTCYQYRYYSPTINSCYSQDAQFIQYK